MKDKIKQWFLDNRHKYELNLDGHTDIIYDCIQDLGLSNEWVSVDSIDLMRGDRWLCDFNGESIVLEIGQAFPTNNKPYYFWFEPYMDDLEIECHEVARVLPLPPSEAKL